MGSIQLPPLDLSTITVGQAYTYTLLNVKQGSSIKFINDSPYNVAIRSPTGMSDILSSGEVQVYNLNNNDVSLQLVPTLLAVQWPTTILYGIIFDPDTPPSGIYPFWLGRSTNIGNMIVASNLINIGNSPGTQIIQGSSSPGEGSISLFNDGSGTVKLYDSGSSLNAISLTNGTNITEAVAIFGNSSDLNMTNFYGDATLNNLSFENVTSINGVNVTGIWAIVGNTNRQHITTTGLQTILTFNAPITGIYRASGYFNKVNATSSDITFQITYTDPDDATLHTTRFSCDISGTYTNLRGSTGVVNVAETCFTEKFAATIATAITISWNDPSGTPNDYISADVEVLL
jgi:hypothetical protein